MIIIKVFIWYVAVVFCYARNIFLWRGTRWCGYGSAPTLSKNFSSALIHKNSTTVSPDVIKPVDECCKQHDHCPYYIERWQRKYNLLNWRPYTISSCECDHKFKKCLEKETSLVSNDLIKIFFDILEVPCFVIKLKVEKKCIERTWFMACKKHAMRTESYAEIQYKKGG